MTEFHLQPEQKQALEDFLSPDTPETLRRRALLLLLYDQGMETEEVANQVGLSLGRVRSWRAQFRSKGMKVFPSFREKAEPADEHQADSSEEQAGADTKTGETSRAPSGGPQGEVEDEAGQADEHPPDLPPIQEDEHKTTPEGDQPRSGRQKSAKRQQKKKDEEQELLPYPKPRKSVGLQPEDPMAEAGRKTLLFHFAAMLAHEAGTRKGEDIEELHDMRVATRRMRAAFDVFANAFEQKKIKKHFKGLKETGRALGRVRDLDVFMEKAQAYIETLPAERQLGMQPLLAAWDRKREAERAHMNSYLDSDRYREFKENFNRFLQTPGAGARNLDAAMPEPNRVCEVAPVLIYQRLGAVRAYETCLADASIEELHALRIEFKKLRYTVEYFREVLGEQAENAIRDIKQLQDHLGDLNDADVATRILREFLDGWDAEQEGLPLSERENPAEIVNYLAYCHAERYRLMTTFQEKWAFFCRAEFRANLAQAVGVL